MKTIYLTNGKLNDDDFTGVTVTHYFEKDSGEIVGQNSTIDGKPYFGYLPNKVTEDEYKLWKERIAKPDGVVTTDTAKGVRTYTGTYFAGIFPGIGVIDAATRKMLDDKIDASKAAAEAQRKATMAVKPVQAMDALFDIGITETDIYGAIEKLPKEMQGKAVIWYAKSQSFRRDNPYVIGIGKILGLDDEKLDAVFAAAELVK